MRDFEQEMADKLNSVKVEDLTKTAKQYRNRGFLMIAVAMIPSLAFLALVLFPTILTLLLHLNEGFDVSLLPASLIVTGVILIGMGTSRIARFFNAIAYENLYYFTLLTKDKDGAK